ncbi:MAG TPA: hypothetical protein VFO16_15290 [Pseudonocardiaceae bacterium]|nr:hypothetical protein [Pseudonocardiaceae bacterium]
MIREDRELLAELARVNRDMAPLAMRIMEGSADPSEQRHYGQRLIAVGRRLCERVDGSGRLVIPGEFVAEEPLALPMNTAEPYRAP